MRFTAMVCKVHNRLLFGNGRTSAQDHLLSLHFGHSSESWDLVRLGRAPSTEMPASAGMTGWECRLTTICGHFRQIRPCSIADVKVSIYPDIMLELICEIWLDEDDGSHGGGQISENHDRIRRAVSPNSVLLHTYTAHSLFEVFQKNYDFHGYGKWKPPEGMSDHFFTEEEVEEQQRYLVIRNGR